jgi:hypothetical protein
MGNMTTGRKATAHSTKFMSGPVHAPELLSNYGSKNCSRIVPSPRNSYRLPSRMSPTDLLA